MLRQHADERIRADDWNENSPISDNAGVRPIQYYACVQLPRIILSTAFALASFAQTTQPLTLPLWPQGMPEPWHVEGQERNMTKPSDGTPGGRLVTRIGDVSQPSLTVYSPNNATGV